VISDSSTYGCSREPVNTSAAKHILKPENVKIAEHTHTHTHTHTDIISCFSMV